jgi:iron complex transport system substrate-binding protein
MLILALGAPAAASEGPDMLGRRVPIPDRPLRLVSLAPSLTEIVFALGRGDWLVGATDVCDFPPAARDLPRVGGIAAPNLERIVALRPDLVLTTAEGNTWALLGQLASLKVPSFALIPDSVTGVLASIRTLGQALRVEGVAEALAREVEARVGEVQRRVAGRERPRVLYLVWPEPMIAAGPGTYIHDLLRIAGGQNIIGGRTVAYPRLGWEEVVGRRPDVVLIASHRDAADPAAAAPVPADWRPWQTVPAVRAGRVLAVSSDTILRPGPRLPDGVKRLARAIHPEAFPRGTRGGQ